VSTELSLTDRAVAALGQKEHEQELIALAESSKTITAITNKAGYQQVHSARMALKARRVEIERLGKSARDDANKFAKAVIAEENRLIGLIRPEEQRLARMQEAHDAEELRISVEKAEAETRRVEALKARVEAIRCLPDDCWMKSAAEIEATLNTAKAMAIGEDFQEFREQAQSALFSAIQSLEGIHCKRLADDAEKEKLRLEREELVRLRAETERLQAAERARIAEAERVARQAREAEDAARAAELKKEREAQAAEARRLADERAQFEREQEQARQAKAAEERRRAEQARLANMKPPAQTELIDVLRQHYNVPSYKVVEWLGAIDWSKAVAA
jgi:hypothetical protein